MSDQLKQWMGWPVRVPEGSAEPAAAQGTADAVDERQAEIPRSEAKRGILNCTRQWGKSTIAAAKAVHRDFIPPRSLVLAASPTYRQSGEFVRKGAKVVAMLGLPGTGRPCAGFRRP